MPELSTIGISASLLLSLTSLTLVVLMLTGVMKLKVVEDSTDDDGGKAAVKLQRSYSIC